MSDFFEVTTDYLLKGIEPVSDAAAAAGQKPDARIFAAVGTAFNFMGVMIAAMIWHEEQAATAIAAGSILIIMGCMVYGIGMVVSDPATQRQAKRRFWAINVWPLTFMPLSVLYNIFVGAKIGWAPYPILVGGIVRYALFWFVYIAIGVAVDLTQFLFMHK